MAPGVRRHVGRKLALEAVPLNVCWSQQIRRSVAVRNFQICVNCESKLKMEDCSLWNDAGDRGKLEAILLDNRWKDLASATSLISASASCFNFLWKGVNRSAKMLLLKTETICY